jgi:cell fate (sporulation/competence/biofilm development) regulator YlbF (YheA/YmcA/DUF963 family)
MTITEQTHELGKLIKASAEMAAYKAAEEAQMNDEEAKALMQEFNLNRMNLARDMQDGKISQEEAVKKNNKAFEEMTEKSEVIRNFIEAKKQFDAVIGEINGILNYYITGQEPGCTHDCGSCGGCH